jgi:WD40 repeat protein
MARFKAHPAGLPIRALAFSSNGDVLATATDGSEAQLWSVRGRKLATLEGHKGGINDLEFSPKGPRVPDTYCGRCSSCGVESA